MSLADWLDGRLHPVLARQLRRHLHGAAPTPELTALMEAVNESYHDADDERRLMANTIAATSGELVDRHERLQRSERSYRELFESNPWPQLICDPETLRIVAVNDTAVGRYGYDRETLSGIRLNELGSPEDTARLRTCVEEAMRATEGGIARPRATLRTQHRLRNGSIVDVELTAQGIEYAGQPTCLVAAVDVTEQVAAFRAVRAGESRLRSIFDHAALGICEMDLEGCILATNPAFERLLDYTADELQGRALVTFAPPDEATVLLGPLRELTAGRYGAFTVEQHLKRKDGKPIWGSLTVSMMDLGSGPARLLALLQDVSERKELEAQLTRQAFQDSLTGLANRALFRDRVAHALARGARTSSGVAVLFIDLDGFKMVNDGLGHSAGDRLLVTVGTRLEATMRASDTVARLGGDEFAVLLEGVTNESEVLSIAERALAAIRGPVTLPTAELFVGASIGAAFGRDAQSAEELLRNSDVAMYAAKSAGKGKCAIFEPGMHQRVVERQQLEADLRPALERGEFRVVYQPIFELATRRLRGVESLLRWHHSQRGIIPPGRFIGAAEETGLIVPIGMWVLEETCSQAAAWRGRFWDLDADGNTDFSVSVNISARQLRDDRFVDNVRAVLERTGLPPRMLLLEITESVLVSEMDAATGRLEALRSLGVQLAIDDFGTGYSSLSYLRRFPVSVLKIDKSFTDGVGRNVHDAAIIRTIVNLAGTLSLRAIAEGVEDADQHRALVRAGCEFGQGFHFARPGTAVEIERLAETWVASPIADHGVAAPGATHS